jgi:hypothetical protein
VVDVPTDMPFLLGWGALKKGPRTKTVPPWGLRKKPFNEYFPRARSRKEKAYRLSGQNEERTPPESRVEAALLHRIVRNAGDNTQVSPHKRGGKAA